MSQFVDQVRIQVQSGDGGNGMVAWRREKYEPLGGPAGGSGGKGGSVYLQATTDMSTLLDFHYQKEYKANPGEKGGPKNKHGKQGQDLVIKVPVGTLVRDAETKNVIADLTHSEQKVMVAEGGRGGRGNTQLATHGNRAPHYCEPGEVGIHRELELELKLLADVGIVGLPNAGKSTTLSVLTAAKPKIADYPFSTLQPNLGVVRKPNGDGYVMADIPGLVSGASQGIGLGHKFLRHVERTRLILHIADITDPELEKNIATIGDELNIYNERLGKLPQILALNKIDLLESPDMIEEITSVIKSRLKELLPHAESIRAVVSVSGATRDGFENLKSVLLDELNNLPVVEELHHIVEDSRAHEHPDDGFIVDRKKNKFYVSGTRVERIVGVTNTKSPEAVFHLVQVLKAMGIIDALLQAGVQPGHEIFIGETAFTFGEDMY